MNRYLCWAAGSVISLFNLGSAVAADLPVKAPPPVAPVMTWTGFYVGLNAGGAWDDDRSVNTVGVPVAGFADGVGPGSYVVKSAAGATGTVPDGNNGRFIGGGQIGYNWQFGQGVAGFEADIDGLAQQSRTGTLGTTIGPFPFAGAPEVINSQITSTRSLDYLGTIRGRLGYLATPSLLLYGTGGGAYGGVSASTSIAQSNNDCVFFPGDCLAINAASFGSASTTRFGWTVGAGGEWMFAPNWSAKAEYLYYDLGSISYNSQLATTNGTFAAAAGPAVVNVQSTAKFDGSIVRVGINYHFSGPILAKY
jgi:outer membrane immunogenic protein